MSSLRDYIGPGRRMLARRLDHLCATLESLSVRLRSTIANAIGETIGAIVRDTALGILDEVTRFIPESPSMSRYPRRNRLGQDGYGPDERGYWPDEEDEDVAYDRENHDRQEAPERLPTALSAGLQAASWWLRRWSGQCRLATTLVVGALVTGVAFIGGPLAVAVLTLVGSAAQFTSLSEVIGPDDRGYSLYEPS